MHEEREYSKTQLKNKHGGDEIINPRLLTMLNTKLKTLAKVLVNRLQALLLSLIDPPSKYTV